MWRRKWRGVWTNGGSTHGVDMWINRVFRGQWSVLSDKNEKDPPRESLDHPTTDH